MTHEYVIRIEQQLSPVVKGFRHVRGLNQTAAGSRLGLTQRTYSALELHPGRTSVARFLALLSALGVEMVLRDKESSATLNATSAPPEW